MMFTGTKERRRFQSARVTTSPDTSGRVYLRLELRGTLRTEQPLLLVIRKTGSAVRRVTVERHH